MTAFSLSSKRPKFGLQIFFFEEPDFIEKTIELGYILKPDIFDASKRKQEKWTVYEYQNCFASLRLG